MKSEKRAPGETLVLRGGLAVLPQGPRKLDIRLRNGKIAEIAEEITDGETLDVSGLWVLPGMLDVHTHGGAGVDVNHADLKDLERLARFFTAQGVTGFLPTVLTGTESEMAGAIRAIAQARASRSGAQVLGCHLEGPFLAAAYKGAMPEALLQEGDLALANRLQEAGEGCILRMTVSPEVPGVLEMIPELTRMGIGVSLGHSGADYEQAMACIAAGADSATHTMNAMVPLHQHRPGILGAVLESDLYCEIICDGLHLHPGIVRLLTKAKGIRRIVAVTDSIAASGLGDGGYWLGAQPTVVKDGDAWLADGSSRAGSTLTMARALRNFMAFTGLPIEQAILPMTQNPAALLGLEGRKGRIAVGMDADLTVLDTDLAVRHTFVGQRHVFGPGEGGGL